MKIEDYKKADCSLLRLPPIDASSVMKAIELELAKAWENGSSANGVIDSILRNDAVLNQVKDQISDSLEFQRATAMDSINEEKESNIQHYKNEKEAKLQQVEESLGSVVSEKEDKLKEMNERLSSKHSGYSASQKRLEEMRSRIQERLKEIGGKEGFETLLSIQDMVKDKNETRNAKSYDAKKESEAEELSCSKEPIYELRKVISAVDSKEKIDPLAGKNLEEVVKAAEESNKKHGRVYHFFKKVWEVLNYEI